MRVFTDWPTKGTILEQNLPGKSFPYLVQLPSYRAPTGERQGMLRSVLGSRRRFCDDLTRRETLRAGTLALLGGFGLPELLQAEELRQRDRYSGPARPRASSCCICWAGAATQDMFDLKPNAPVEIRGEFKPIATNVPGIQICEHLPRLAAVDAQDGPRPLGQPQGRLPQPPAQLHRLRRAPAGHHAAPRTPIRPAWARSASTSRQRHGRLARLRLPAQLRGPAGARSFRRPGPYAGFLGKRYDPLFSECDPTTTQDGPRTRGRPSAVLGGEPFLRQKHRWPTASPLDRLQHAAACCSSSIDQHAPSGDAAGRSTTSTASSSGPSSLLTSTKLKNAFDLEHRGPDGCATATTAPCSAPAP